MTTPSTLVSAESRPTNPIQVWTPVALLVPNWEEPVEVRSQYRTAIFTGGQSAETRRAQMSAPARTLSFGTRSYNGTASRLMEILQNRLAQAGTLMPLWPDWVTLTAAADSADTVLATTSTAHRRFVVGARVAVFRYLPGSPVVEDYTLAVIDSVGASSVTLSEALGADHVLGAIVVPLIEGAASFGNEYTWRTDRLIETSIEAREIPGAATLDASAAAGTWPAALQAEGSYAVWPWYSNDDGEHLAKVEFPGEAFDIGIGQIFSQPSAQPRTTYQFSHHFTRAEWWTFNQLFDACRGSLHPFWFLSPGANMSVSAISGTSITIDAVGPESAWDEVDYLGLELEDGTFEFRTVDGQVRVGDSDVISVTEAWTASLGDISRCGVALLARFGTDEVLETWQTDDHVTVEAQLIELRAEADYAVTVASPYVGPVGVAGEQEASGCAALSAWGSLGYPGDGLIALYAPRADGGVDDPLEVSTLYNLASGDDVVHGDMLWASVAGQELSRSLDGVWLDIVAGRFMTSAVSLNMDTFTAFAVCKHIPRSVDAISKANHPFARGTANDEAIFRVDENASDQDVSYRSNDSQVYSTSPNFDTYQPLVLCIRREADSHQHWLNGQKIGSHTQSTADCPFDALGITAAGNNPFRGSVGDLALYNRAMIDDEIADLSSNLMGTFAASTIPGVTTA